jgi:hypothetical protein
VAEFGCGRVVVEAGGQTGAQQAIVEADKEQAVRPGIGDAIAMAARDAFDHAMETKAAQLIADGAGWHGVG